MQFTSTDMLGRSILLCHKPQRIVSLVPSQTELLADLGLEEEVIGITKFCVHPMTWFRTKKRIGGTKQIHIDKIAALQPDLIIANKEENEKTQIEELCAHFPVWISDIVDIADALEMIKRVGALVGRTAQAITIREQIQQSFQQIPKVAVRPRVAYFIWKDPYMVAANNTFIDAMLSLAGFDNVFREEIRYPQVDLNIVADKQPDVIFLSSEPFPFKPVHFEAFESVCPNAIIEIVDGELFSWYGSRLLKSATYLESLKAKILDKLGKNVPK